MSERSQLPYLIGQFMAAYRLRNILQSVEFCATNRSKPCDNGQSHELIVRVVASPEGLKCRQRARACCWRFLNAWTGLVEWQNCWELRWRHVAGTTNLA